MSLRREGKDSESRLAESGFQQNKIVLQEIEKALE